jgi:hypothetical protein
MIFELLIPGMRDFINYFISSKDEKMKSNLRAANQFIHPATPFLRAKKMDEKETMTFLGGHLGGPARSARSRPCVMGALSEMGRDHQSRSLRSLACQ